MRNPNEVFDILVKGTQFKTKTGESRRNFVKNLIPGNELILEREYDNKQDEYAVLVLNKNNVDIGYIDREYSEVIAKKLDQWEYCEVKAFVKKVYEKYDIFFCVILVEVYAKNEIFDDKNKEYRETGKLMFLDLETTGLPVSWNIPPKRFEHWPHIVEVACIITDYEGNEIENFRQIVKPEGWTIPTPSVRIHKISNKIAESEGLNVLFILEALESKILDVDFIIAHNTEFDLQVLEAEFYRYDMNPDSILKTPTFCTMKNFTNYCGIPNKKGYGYKYPKLEELNEIVFGQSIPNAHSALSDAYATMFCFFELKKQGLFNFETPEERKQRKARRKKQREELAQKRKFLQDRDEYKQTSEYKTEYEKLHRSLSLRFKGSSDVDIIQKRNTMRSNIVNRRKTIKKLEEQINSEEDINKLYHLDEKLKKKYLELNSASTKLEVLDDLLNKKEVHYTEPGSRKSWSTEELQKIQEEAQLQERKKMEKEENEGCLKILSFISIAILVAVLLYNFS